MTKNILPNSFQAFSLWRSASKLLIGFVFTLLSLIASVQADTRVLVIGGSQGYQATQEMPFPPTAVAEHLRMILEQAPGISAPVTVQVEDYGARQSLMSWYYWPDQRSRIAALLRESWDHVILLEDPFFASRHPQFLFEGVHSIREATRVGGAAVWLVMQWSSGATSLATFAEAAYRVGDGTGVGVIPAGYAWQSVPAGNKDSGTRPTPKGAYVTAAAAFSRIYERSAVDSAYVPMGLTPGEANLLAESAWNAVQTAKNQIHYSGAFTGPTHFTSPPFKNRNISFYGQGTSTENGMNLALREVLPLTGVQGVSVASQSNPSTKQDVWYRRDSVSLTHGRSVAYFTFQWDNGAKSMVDAINSFSYGPANRVMAYATTPGYPVFHMPIYIALARLRTERAEIAVQPDKHHMSDPFHHSTAAMMVAQATGRCGVGDEPADPSSEAWQKWYGRKTGYEVAWQHATLRSRVPGFEVLPSTVRLSTPNLSPSADESLTVRFLYEPTAPVTVNISASKPGVVLLSPSQLTFSPTNFKQKQVVRFRALPGALASDPVVIQLTTASEDPVFDGLSDSWDYNITRSTTTTVPVTMRPPLAVSLPEDTATVVNLGVAGATPANTTILGPLHGTWSMETSTYTPNPDYYGPDSFTFVTNTGSAITTGRVDLTISDLPDPSVTLTAPPANASYDIPTTITLAVSGHWQGGEVRFYADDELVGTALSAPWSVEWKPKQVGQVSLRAVVRDSLGATLETPPLAVSLNSQGPFWTGVDGGLWSAANHWSTGAPPQAGEKGLFNMVELNGVRAVTLQGYNSTAGLVFGQSGDLSPRWIMGPDALGSPILDEDGPQPPGWILEGQPGAQLKLTGADPTIEVSMPRPPFSIAPIHPGWIYQELDPTEYVATLRVPLTAESLWRKTGSGRLVLDYDNLFPNGFAVLSGEVLAASPGATGIGPISLAMEGVLRVADGEGLHSEIRNAITLTGNQPGRYRIGPGFNSSLTLGGSIDGTQIHSASELALGYTRGSLDLRANMDLGGRSLIFSNTWPYDTSGQQTRITDATIRAGKLISNYGSFIGGDLNTFTIGGRSNLQISDKVELVCFWGNATFGDQARLETNQLDVFLTQFSLTGGTISLNNLHSRRTASASNGKVTFNGGKLVARQSTNNFITSDGGLVEIADRGLSVDTGAHVVTIPVGFDTGSQFGGIRKQGSGSLILNPDPALSGNPNTTNRFRGAVMVLEGTLETGHERAFTAALLHEVRSGAVLRLRHNAVNDNAGLDIRSGGLVELGSGINDTIRTLYFDGVEQPAGIWGAPGSGAERIDVRFAGSGLLTVTSGGTGNRAPVANPDSYSVPAGEPLSVAGAGVVANDTDGNKNTLRAFVERPPAHGTLVLATTGSFTYQPNPGFSGTDEFVYYAFDGKVNSLPVTVEITVEAPDLPNTFDSWAAGYPFLNAEDALPGADPDGDGFVNFLEYTFASGPLSPEREGLPAMDVGTDRISLIYRKNLLATDVQITPEASTDLRTWDYPDVTDEFLRIEGSLEFRKASASIPPGGSVFLRLKVTPRQ